MIAVSAARANATSVVASADSVRLATARAIVASLAFAWIVYMIIIIEHILGGKWMGITYTSDAAHREEESSVVMNTQNNNNNDNTVWINK